MGLSSLLTQTVIESPVVHWILPVNIRGSQDDRDVAFIGDHSVQIRYLKEDGQFEDVARRDFESRIRNARVVGGVEHGVSSTLYDKSEDIEMGDPWGPTATEYIVLALEDGNVVCRIFGRL
jgi:hypothetical protein